MPGFYDVGKYDIAGFAVGLVDRKDTVDGRAIRTGDALIGIASSGPHSNGFSLIRKVLPDLNEDFGGMPIGRALLEPTRLYVAPVLELMAEVPIRGMAHITGGGFYENIPRMFSEPLQATIFEGSWTIPPIFARLAYGINAADATAADGDVAQGKLTGKAAQEAGKRMIAEDGALRRSMFNTFNMGIGFVLAVAPEDAERTIEFLDAKGFPAWRIGRVDPAAAAGTEGGAGGKGQVGEVRFVRA
jgi:phosphoribosylformylglycinamidine cyclo-ligase